MELFAVSFYWGINWIIGVAMVLLGAWFLLSVSVTVSESLVHIDIGMSNLNLWFGSIFVIQKLLDCKIIIGVILTSLTESCVSKGVETETTRLSQTDT